LVPCVSLSRLPVSFCARWTFSYRVVSYRTSFLSFLDQGLLGQLQRRAVKWRRQTQRRWHQLTDGVMPLQHFVDGTIFANCTAGFYRSGSLARPRHTAASSPFPLPRWARKASSIISTTASSRTTFGHLPWHNTTTFARKSTSHMGQQELLGLAISMSPFIPFAIHCYFNCQCSIIPFVNFVIDRIFVKLLKSNRTASMRKYR